MKKKVFEAVEQLKNDGEKITVSAISRIAGIDRRTVKKYY
jgi:Fic family protein